MPLYLSHLQRNAEDVPALIRAARVEAGLSLRALSARVGISFAQLSNIETGKAHVTLAQLVQLSAAIRVPVTTLLPPSGTRSYLIDRRADLLEHEKPMSAKIAGLRAGTSKYHNLLWPLAELYCGKSIEPFLASVRRAKLSELPLLTSEPEAFVFVLAGRMEFRAKTGDHVSVERLSAGDALYWRSFVAHSSRAIGQEPTEVIVVHYVPSGTPDLATELAVASEGSLHQLYRERVTDVATEHVGQRINYLRRSQGIALGVLARQLGIKPRQLAAVELGEGALHIDVLFAVARLFRRPIEYFLPNQVDGEPPFGVIRRADIVRQPAMRRSNDSLDGACYFPMSCGLTSRGMHPYYVQLNSTAGAAVTREPGQQFVHVLQGEVEFLSAEIPHGRELLRPSDSLFFDTSVPHELRARTKSPFAAFGAEMITVFWSPAGTSPVCAHIETIVQENAAS